LGLSAEWLAATVWPQEADDGATVSREALVEQVSPHPFAKMTAHPDVTWAGECRLTDRLAQEILAEEGDAGFSRLVRIPKLRMGSRSGEETIASLWEYALAHRPSGVLWTQMCEETNTYWGFWRPTVTDSPARPVSRELIKHGLTVKSSDDEVYAVFPRPSLPAMLKSVAQEAAVKVLRPLEIEQLVKGPRLFELTDTWLSSQSQRDLRQLFVSANTSSLRTRLLRRLTDLNATDLDQIRPQEWSSLLLTPTRATPRVIAHVWRWITRELNEMAVPSFGTAGVLSQPSTFDSYLRIRSDVLRVLLSHPLPSPPPMARHVLWQWRGAAPHTPQGHKLHTLAWEVWSEPSVRRTREETSDLVKEANRAEVWARLVTAPDLTREERLQLMTSMYTGRPPLHDGGPANAHESPDLESRRREASRQLEALPITDTDPELFLALARMCAPQHQMYLATRTENATVRQSILGMVFEADHLSILKLLERQDFRPLLQHLSPSMMRSLFMSGDRDLRLRATKLLGKSRDVKREAPEVTPLHPARTIRKLRRLL